MRQGPAAREVDIAHEHPAESELPAVELPSACRGRRAAPVTILFAGIAGGFLTPARYVVLRRDWRRVGEGLPI